ncbi:MAG: hypothetical protein ACK5NK_09540 [Niabella sp.]
MFNKLFNWGKKDSGSQSASERNFGQDITFGRYSDNNKSLEKTNRWTTADNYFKDNKPYESMDSFFNYLKDDAVNNLDYNRSGETADFKLYQGSKIIEGRVQDGQLTAKVKLARMPQPSVPVMRRLLEMNFGLYYSRFALEEDDLCMRFDTSMLTANPNKLYYGLKELATKSDKQDDLLIDDFNTLETVGNDHIIEIPEKEKQAKYDAIQSWIKETLEKIAAINSNDFSGGINYLLLTLAYRIDFLIVPEGSLLNDIEKIVAIYFKKDDRPIIEKNRDMMDAFKELQAKPKEEIFKSLFRSRHTFAIVAPPNIKTIADVIEESNKNMQWYRVNNHEYFANRVVEYGLAYNQYSYSLPRPVTELFELYMRINYPEYFSSLGQQDDYYDPQKKNFNYNSINNRINKIISVWRPKYPFMVFKTGNLNYTGLLAFNESFTNQVKVLNLES